MLEYGDVRVDVTRTENGYRVDVISLCTAEILHEVFVTDLRIRGDE